MNLQMHDDLEVERDRLGSRLRIEVPVLKRAGCPSLPAAEPPSTCGRTLQAR